MATRNPNEDDEPLLKRAGRRWACLVLAGIALLWLASCEPKVVTPAATPAVTRVLPIKMITVLPEDRPGLPALETAVQAEGTTEAKTPEAPQESAPTAIPAEPTEVPEPTPEAPPPLAIVPLASDTVGLYETIELEIRTVITASNPFDPEELDIRVTFTSENGTAAEIGAFWYQEYDLELGFPLGDPGWRARFTPTETGVWTAVAGIPARELLSEPVTFQVLPSEEPGFVRVHPQNPHYLSFDSGDTFFPIGLNIPWWSGAGTALGDYTKWMDLFAASDGSAIRVWMAEWSFGLEWTDTGLGDYTQRLKKAWQLDQIFNMAQERDLYIMLVLMNCADFNDWQTDGWNHNPYNAANGGPLASADQFTTDATARALLQRRINYIANRWGYATHLLAWEWWNEADLAPFSDYLLIPWLEEMTAYLLARDPNDHLVTNSYAIHYVTPVWSLLEMDIIQKHDYTDGIVPGEKDLAVRVTYDLERLKTAGPSKPAIMGEFGFGAASDGDDSEKDGIHLHNGIWATTFAGYASSGFYWYWDIDVEANRLWYHFQGLSTFLEGLDLTRYRPFSPLTITGPGGEPGQAVGLGMRGEDLLIWLRSEAYTTESALAAWERAGSPLYFDYLVPLVEGQVLALPDMADGTYTIRWYDPQTAHWLDTVEVTAAGGELAIPIPSFRRDLAVRVVPQN